MSTKTLDFNPTPGLLTGRTAIITGSNIGLGYEAAIHLGRLQPARLIVAVRDAAKGNKAAGEIAEKSGLARDRVEVWELDLTYTDSVKAFAARATSTLDRLDVLVENAAVAYMTGWHTAPDSTEEMLKVNGLSTGLLGLLLLPLLHRTAALPLQDGQVEFKPHLTIVSSGTHGWVTWNEPAPGVPLLQDLNDPDSPNAEMRYPLTKLVNVFLARQLARVPQAKDVAVSLVCPGLCVSELNRHLPDEQRKAMRAESIPTAEGAKNIAWAATADFDAGGAAPYVSEMKVVEPSEFARSAAGLDLERRLWAEFVALWKVEVGKAVDAALA